MTAAGTAIAYFTTTGTGESTPKTVSQLAKPTITAATPEAGGTVALSWAAVTAPGTGQRHLQGRTRRRSRRRHLLTTTLTATTCTDSGLEPGTYTYVVTAKWRSWTASSSTKAATVTVGPAHHFVLGAASLTPTAGAADNLTITAKDAKGSTVTTYTGSHSLTFCGRPRRSQWDRPDGRRLPPARRPPSAPPPRSTSAPASPRSPPPTTA